MDQRCSKSGLVKYYTTENIEIFEKNAATFISRMVKCEKVILK
jgi:hypothetical protein